MFEVKTKVIDELKFSVSPFDVKSALKLQAELFRIFGPALGSALGAFSKKDKDSETQIDGNGIGEAIEKLFTQLDPDTFYDLIKRMFGKVQVEVTIEGKTPILFDFYEKFDERLTIVFQGKITTIYKVLIFVLEVNYPDFFEKAGRIGNRLKTTLSEKAKTSASAVLNELEK